MGDLDRLWKLCLMSLLVEDESKLNKIRNMAKMSLLKKTETVSNEPLNDEDMIDEVGNVEICDFYLEKMLSLKAKNEPLISPKNESMETNQTLSDNLNDGEKEETAMEGMGGLIGAMLDGLDKEQEIESLELEEDEQVI